jgi:hypothetical protein
MFASRFDAETIFMIVIALISAACGVVLGHRFRVFVLVPASLLIWVAAIVFAWMHSFSLLKCIGTAFLLAACLQLGYLGGAALAGVHSAYRRKRRHAVNFH